MDSATKIIGNTAVNGNGGAVYFYPYAAKIGDRQITTFAMTLEINGTEISGNKATKNGGAVAIELNYESRNYETGVTISSGNIKNNTAGGNGGAIWMSSDDNCKGIGNNGLTMSGGILDNNTATNGGAIYMTAGTNTAGMDFRMSGGIIINNKSTKNGGAAYIAGGNFSMTGGSLGEENSPNKAVLGGGVYLNGGKATVSGGTVGYNTATEDGAGIYVNGGSATVDGSGLIKNNTAENNGGGTYVSSGSFTLNGDEAAIIGNKADNGAGVYLTGGAPELLCGSMTSNLAIGNGGGIYIDRQSVLLTPTGVVQIKENSAVNGAGIYISGTVSQKASFFVSEESLGTVMIQGNKASENGGGVCIDNGEFTIGSKNIRLEKNDAQFGGAVAVLSGDFSMTGGGIGGDGVGNTAQNGGAVYVDGGNVKVSGGAISNNKASLNGGGIAVNNGNYYMVGGSVDENVAGGSGGGIYVSAPEIVGAPVVQVGIYSGSVSSNTSTGNGGALAVVGAESGTRAITVQIGVNQEHFDKNGTEVTAKNCDHDHIDIVTGEVLDCPQVNSNKSSLSGGAIYVTGSTNTSLDIFCLTEAGNTADGDDGQSCFMKMDGGKVSITTSDQPDKENQSSRFGNTKITSGIYVTGGQMDLWGAMTNPRIENIITVDITKEGDHFIDNRKSDGFYKLIYFIYRKIGY